MPRRTRNTAFSRPITIPDPAPCARESLDLHGYRKEAAIRAVTDFIEQVVSVSPTLPKSRWVTIITGTGQHSTDGT
jgi:DNA-nicking Smr family endonuclease